MKTIATPDQVLGMVTKLLRLLKKAGLRVEALHWPIDDQDFRERLATFWQNRGRGVSISLARKIMKDNFLGLPEAMQYFGIDLANVEEFMGDFATVPFTEELLVECSKTHVLVADLGFSISEIRTRVDEKEFDEHTHWHVLEEILSKAVKPRWRLIKKEPISIDELRHECRFLHKWADLVERFTRSHADEEITSARTMVYAMILYRLVYNKPMSKTNFRVNTIVSYQDMAEVNHLNLVDFVDTSRKGLRMSYYPLEKPHKQGDGKGVVAERVAIERKLGH